MTEHHQHQDEDEGEDQVLFVEAFDSEIEQQVADGATVVYCPPPEQLTGPDTAFAPHILEYRVDSRAIPAHLRAPNSRPASSLGSFPDRRLERLAMA